MSDLRDTLESAAIRTMPRCLRGIAGRPRSHTTSGCSSANVPVTRESDIVLDLEHNGSEREQLAVQLNLNDTLRERVYQGLKAEKRGQ